MSAIFNAVVQTLHGYYSRRECHRSHGKEVALLMSLSRNNIISQCRMVCLYYLHIFLIQHDELFRIRDDKLGWVTLKELERILVEREQAVEAREKGLVGSLVELQYHCL